MDWELVLETTIIWVGSAGLMYLTYEMGKTGAYTGEWNWRSWRTGFLLLAIFFVPFIIGSWPDSYSFLEELSLDEIASQAIAELQVESRLQWEVKSRTLGTFLAFVIAFSVGFYDGRARKKSEKSIQTSP